MILFNRSERYRKLTQTRVLLLADARDLVSKLDLLKARAKGIAGGLESELSVVVDVLVTFAAIAESARAFKDQFPCTPLRLYAKALGGAYQPVIEGKCSLGIVGYASRASFNDGGAIARSRHDNGCRAGSSAGHSRRCTLES